VTGAERGLAQTTESTVLCHVLAQKQDAKTILR
jgi:alanyl aminopeptidase